MKKLFAAPEVELVMTADVIVTSGGGEQPSCEFESEIL